MLQWQPQQKQKKQGKNPKNWQLKKVKNMKYKIEIQYKKPPFFSTTAEAQTKEEAEQIALAHARQNGFKSKPSKVIVKAGE